MNKISILIFIFSFFLYFGCTNSIYTTPSKIPSEKITLSPEVNKENKIIFLTFQITMADSANNKYDVSLINTTLANGLLKKKEFVGLGEIENDQLYFELSENEKGLKKVKGAENPLRMEYEYSKEKGELDRITVIKKTGNVSIRFQYDPSLKYLLIYQPIPTSDKLKLIYRAAILR